MVKDQELFKVGVEYAEIKYEDFWDWFIQFGDLEHHWKTQPTYLISQFAFICGGIATLIHSLIRGGRLPYLWLATALHGLAVECMSYALPDVDNFWHSQTPIMFLGRRLPIHIIFLYPSFIYNSSVAVAKMRLPNWSQPFAVGLGAVLIDIPYDIISVNFLHWTWHDTDPNIGDRHYWVPWNSYYFHACFAASFTFWFHYTRKLICKDEGRWIKDSFGREMACTLITSLLGVPGGVLLFLPIYHPLHDIFKIHSEVTFFILFTIFLLLIWSGDRLPKIDEFSKRFKNMRVHWSTYILVLHLLIHYTSFLIMPIFFNSEDEIAIGIKEPIGPCDQYVPIQTAFGMTLQKRKYLCVTDYDEKYFDFHCLPNKKPPSNGASWYTACGAPLPNRAEYISIATLIWILGATVFWNLHFNSSGDDVFEHKTEKAQNDAKTKLKRT